jgi:hypothetical protein
VVLSTGKLWPKNSAADVANVISLCKTNKLICVLEVHDTTGYGDTTAATLAEAVNYWKDIKSILIGQEAYVIINIGNEPYGNTNVTSWVNDTKNAIAEMRNAGFHHMLMVDAPNWGQDWQFVMRDNAASILASDPDGNTVFSIHMYGVFDTPAKVQNYISTFVNAGLPLVVGEFGDQHTDGNPDEDAIMATAETYGIGYIGWSWSGNTGGLLDMVVNFDPSQMTAWGTRIFKGANGIVKTSCEASVYGSGPNPKVCSITRADSSPTNAANVSFLVKFSETVTGFGSDDLSLVGVSAASIVSIQGTGDAYTVMVNTGFCSGTIHLNLVDNNTIIDSDGNPLGGVNVGDGDFTSGETYTIRKSEVNIQVGSELKGCYPLPPNSFLSVTYPSIVNGPVKVTSTDGSSVFTSQRVTSGDSYNELPGVPANQFTAEYWFPYYDHGYPNVSGSNMRTWILVGNPSTSQTATVNIYIGGALMSGSPFSIAPGANITPRWIGKQGGPVRVVSDIPIFASERMFTSNNNAFNESLGVAVNKLSTQYWFPWYDNVSMKTSIVVGNTSTTKSAKVDIYIGGVKKGSYTIAAKGTISRSYAGLVNGPVKVVSTNGVNIVTSENTVSGTNNSFSDVMGYPSNQFTTEYWFPNYDHGYPNVGGSNMRTWILVGNPSTTQTASVNIYIGGTLMSGSPFSIAPGKNVTPRWLGVQGGPVRVVSMNGVNIFASERVFTVPNSIFNEMLGYPLNQMTSEYWYPWYDSVNMNNDILVGKP